MSGARGAIFSGVDVRDYKMVCGAGVQEFPDSLELKTVRIKNQGAVGSCVAHALSSIIEYYNFVQRDDTTEMSTGYIYGNRRNSFHKGAGMIVRDALDVVRKYGDVPKEYLPQNTEMPAAMNLYEQKADALYEVGRPSRISEYCRITSVKAAKTALFAGVPLLMAMEWYSDMHLENGVLKTNYIGSEGGHCMFIYGWDDRGWKVQNSWGKGWGRDGTFILPYDMPMEECWAVMDDIIEGAHVKKPFSSKAGRFFAKIINWVYGLFRKK